LLTNPALTIAQLTKELVQYCTSLKKNLAPATLG